MRDFFRFYLLSSFLILFLSQQTFSQTNIPTGKVSGKWLKQNSPYYIDGEIKIPRGKKLLIEAGIKVIFTGHYKLIVNGILEAKGTKQDSIYFFPSDTSIGWHGIRFIEAEDFSTLDYCVLRNGKTDRVLEDGDYEKCKADPDCDENDYDGGAILIIHSHPIISNSLITDNQSDMQGAISIKNKSNPKIIFSRIEKNFGGEGGGISCQNGSNPIIKNSIIIGNIGSGLGGGIIFKDYCNPVIDSCIIKNNACNYRGGGICFYTNSKPVVKNSMISDNKAMLGGGIYIDEFYNLFREQPEKIDIQITNTRIENNSAEYGGGVWIRDAVSKFNGITVCNNTASIAGGGIHIEYNPFLFKFSSVCPCNIFMNFARMMGNDLFRLVGGAPMEVPLDTFTVKYYSALNAEPVEKFPITLKNFKLTQVNADFYVSPDGHDSNSGLSPDEPLKSLRIALLRILADSTNPRTVYMGKGEYVFNETNDILMLGKHKYVSVKGAGFTDVIFGTDRITVFTPWWITTWALVIYASILLAIILIVYNVRMRRIRINSELVRKEFEAQKLHEVDEIKTRFFTNISHEFRTPLTLILGPAKRILNKSTDDEIKTDADVIHRSAKKLNRLVDELLDISKIESGEMRLKACPANLVSVIKEISLSFSSLAERKKIAFNINSDEDEITAYIDRAKFDKILSNVLSNAFKFTPEGGRVEVGINYNPELGSGSSVVIKKLKQVQLDNLEISVRDTGIGIPKDQLEKVFDRFYQVDSGHTRQHEGTGIGLALTKELIELHQGKIEVESEEGKGSTFRLIFPLGKDHFKPEEICDEENVKEYGKENQIPELVESLERKVENKVDVELSDKPVLLIVEDNPDVRKYISIILGNQYKIFKAKDGEEGLDKAFECIPELIISDVMMPKMDGFKLCEKLKTDERTSHIPIILLTAKAAKEDKLEGYEIDADDYIMKPFEPDELRARIKNLIEQRKKLHKHFQSRGMFELNQTEITSIDKKFLNKAFELLHQYISDTSFNVEAFSEKMGMSRSVLHKKIVA